MREVLNSTCCGNVDSVAGDENNTLTYRNFTHAASLQRMIAQLPSKSALNKLTTRESDDPAIALLDAWAMSLDVLSFYQQRYQHEDYLNTAVECKSVRELARSIGYELRPGLAADTYLAFTVDEKANSGTGVSNVPKGTQVQSIPVQDALPQTFETENELMARSEWNTLKPYIPPAVIPQVFRTSSLTAKIEGLNTNLQVGDGILITGSYESDQAGQPSTITFREFRTLTKVITQADTLIQWAKRIDDDLDVEINDLKIFVFRHQVGCFGHNAPPFVNLAKLELPKDMNWDINNPSIFQDASLNYYTNAHLYLSEQLNEILSDSWVALKSGSADPEIYKVEEIVTGSLADFALSGQVTGLILKNLDGDILENPDTDSNAKNDKPTDYKFRETTIYVQSEELPLFIETNTDVDKFISGNEIELDHIVSDFESGHSLIIHGETPNEEVEIVQFEDDENNNDIIVTLESPLKNRYETGSLKFEHPCDSSKLISATVEEPGTYKKLRFSKEKFNQVSLCEAIEDNEQLNLIGVTLLLEGEKLTSDKISEVITVSSSKVNDQDRTKITLEENLKNKYQYNSVVIYGNVVAASHGETVEEVLGSGIGSQVNQTFTLKEPPLTYLSASTLTGIQSTLEIRVNGVLWHEVPSLHGLSSNSQSYTVRHNEDGQIVVTFGDGIQGARLPSGNENVVATYRTGIGLAGNVAENSIALLKTRPLGILSVTNPLSALNGAEAENLENARDNAPLTVLTIGRVVSFRDFENFAQSFAGVGKAKAALIKQGQKLLLHITIAGQSEQEVSLNLIENLENAIEQIRNPGQALELIEYESLKFNVDAELHVDTNYRFNQVKEQVETRLKDIFSFDKRDFGQDVTASEVIKVIQEVPGVIAIDLNGLCLEGGSGLNTVLEAKLTRANPANPDDIRPAQLLTINENEGGINLEEPQS